MKIINLYKATTYHNIAYPMLLELGFKEIYPMDSQEYDMNWNASNDVFNKQLDKFEKDSINNKTYKSLANKMQTIVKKFNDNEKTSRLTEYINTDDWNDITDTYDFLMPEMYDLPNFPKEAIVSARHWWQMRNQTMCQNTIDRASKIGVKRIVIFVGGHHRKYMQDIFKKMPLVNVRNINEWK